jgi:hypothetical protein
MSWRAFLLSSVVHAQNCGRELPISADIRKRRSRAARATANAMRVPWIIANLGVAAGGIGRFLLAIYGIQVL